MRISNEHTELSTDIANPRSSSFAIDLADIVGILRRRWMLVLIGILIGGTGAVTVVASMPEPYKSSARVLIDRSLNRYLQTNKIVDEPTFDDAETSGQMWVMSSESIIVPVVRSLNLMNDPEFVSGYHPPDESDRWSLRGMARLAKSALGLHTSTALEADVVRERIAVEAFLKRLSVYREDVANVINITFASKDPKKAADIANAIADTYLATTLAAKSNSTKMANKLLQERLMELKLQAANADRALQEYKMASNLVGSGKGGAMSTEQLTSLTNHLTSARVAMAEAKARMERQADGVAGVMTPDNEIILRLRGQYLELAARATDLESRVGAEHIAVVKIRKRMEDLRGSIRDEQERLAGNYAMEYQLARARHDELTATISQVLSEEGSNSKAQVTIRELESSAETMRNLYNEVLQRFSQMNKIETQAPIIQDARIITRAAPPLQKGSKKALAILGGGVFLGFMLGVGAAIAKDFRLGVFRTPEQVTRATGIYCAVLPTIQPQNRAQSVDDYVLDAPYSRFAETLRNVWALISYAQRENGDKVICVVSSVAKEGKTTVVSNLASLLSVCSMMRTLVIDCDLHRRSLTTRMAPNARVGLLEALKNPSNLSNCVHKVERSGLHVLPCALSARIPNAADLLGSRHMEQLLDAARESYDLVIVEVAPIVSVVDLKMIERFMDRFIFVIEWGRTGQRLVQEALVEAGNIESRVLCALLNRADPAALRSIEAYKGPRFADYYQEEKQA